jgi:hypothetical protein
MTKKYRMLSRTLMLLTAMVFLVVATPAMSQKACPTGYADCDGNKQNKCETNLQTNVNSCGACGKVCSLSNATSACANGSCQVSACSAGYSDCDRTASNGCEINIQTDTKNCSACGKACSLCHATSSCENGNCKIQSCTNPWVDRDGKVSNGCESAWCGFAVAYPPYQTGYSTPTATGGWVCTWRCPSGKQYTSPAPGSINCGNWYEYDQSCGLP